MYLETDYMEFHAILLKACDTDPRDRYPTAQAMSADLALLRKGKSIKRLHLFERRLKIFKKFGIVTALLAVLALSATLYQLHLVDRNRQLASELRKSSYAVDINLAFQAIQDADLPEAKELLERHRPTDGNDLRDWGWYWLRNQAKGDQYDSFTSSTTNWYPYHLSFSKDGKYLSNGYAVFELESNVELSYISGLHQKVWVKKDGSVPNCCVKPQVKISITCFARPAALI